FLLSFGARSGCEEFRGIRGRGRRAGRPGGPGRRGRTTSPFSAGPPAFLNEARRKNASDHPGTIPGWSPGFAWPSVDRAESVGEQSEQVRRDERTRVVLLEVEPPDAVAQTQGHGPPIEGHFRVGVEWADVRPGLPGVGRRVADRREVGV